MNERIGKLAVKAGAHWEHGDWNMPSAVYFSERDLEKFAEMIVLECAACCGSQADMRNIRKRFGLPVESNIKYPSPDAIGHYSQYGREYNIPKE
jgi:hypothetical protein